MRYLIFNEKSVYEFVYQLLSKGLIQPAFFFPAQDVTCTRFFRLVDRMSFRGVKSEHGTLRYVTNTKTIR